MLKSKLIPEKFINNTNVIVLKYAKIEIINFKNKRRPPLVKKKNIYIYIYNIYLYILIKKILSTYIGQ